MGSRGASVEAVIIPCPVTDSQSSSKVATGRSRDRRAHLLSSARSVFAAKGYEAATVSEIVAGAGVAQGTFYIYFPGKESLAAAFAEELADRFAEVDEEKA